MFTSRRFGAIMAGIVLFGSVCGVALATTGEPGDYGNEYGCQCKSIGTISGCQSCSDHKCGIKYGYGTQSYYSCQAGGYPVCDGIGQTSGPGPVIATDCLAEPEEPVG